MNKKGAFHPLMDPFKMEANRNIVPNYKDDMCPKTLDILSKVTYVYIDPEWNDEQRKARIELLRKTLKEIQG